MLVMSCLSSMSIVARTSRPDATDPADIPLRALDRLDLASRAAEQRLGELLEAGAADQVVGLVLPQLVTADVGVGGEVLARRPSTGARSGGTRRRRTGRTAGRRAAARGRGSPRCACGADSARAADGLEDRVDVISSATVSFSKSSRAWGRARRRGASSATPGPARAGRTSSSRSGSCGTRRAGGANSTFLTISLLRPLDLLHWAARDLGEPRPHPVDVRADLLRLGLDHLRFLRPRGVRVGVAEAA